jgi:hypothetical protein
MVVILISYLLLTKWRPSFAKVESKESDKEDNKKEKDKKHHKG